MPIQDNTADSQEAITFDRIQVVKFEREEPIKPPHKSSVKVLAWRYGLDSGGNRIYQREEDGGKIAFVIPDTTAWAASHFPSASAADQAELSNMNSYLEKVIATMIKLETGDSTSYAA